MNPKRQYYIQYVHRRVRLRKLIYFLIFIILLGIVLYDSYYHDLPFHYVLYMLLGLAISRLLAKTQKAERRVIDNKLTVKYNLSSILIILMVIVLRIYAFPKVLSQFNVIFISDAVLLIVMGWFFGRVKLLSDQIEGEVFANYIKNNT